MKKICLPALSALLALLPVQGLRSQPSSPTPVPDADAQCVLAFELLGQDLSRAEPNISDENRNRRNVTRAGLAYFIARLADRLAGSELESAIASSNASLHAEQMTEVGARCLSEYDAAKQRIDDELRAASTAPAQPLPSSSDHDLICFAIFSDTSRRIPMMPSPLDPEIVNLQESLRFITPLYAARVVARYESGRLGPALRDAIRDIPEDRADEVTRGCFHDAGPPIDRVIAAMERVLGSNPPGQ